MGGLMQLVTYGKQDQYIHGNPQITFFKSVYRRHTNFAIESIPQIITHDDSSGGESSVTISKGNGDLINKIYMVYESDYNIYGDELIQEVELIIGGTTIDKHTNEWLKVWRELSTPLSKAEGTKYMSSNLDGTLLTRSEIGRSSVIVPLQFWFCRYPGLSLPIISLTSSDVKLKFKNGIFKDIKRDPNQVLADGFFIFEVWIDYIFLDTEERVRFAQGSHEYLIEQVQKQDGTPIGGTASTSYDLHFNHPVKEIIWTEGNTGTDKITNQKMNITLNGVDRTQLQYKEYYQFKQPLDHHTTIPGYNIKEYDRPQLLKYPKLIIGGNNVVVAPSVTSDNEFYVKYATDTTTNLKISTSLDDLRVGDLINIYYPIASGKNININATITTVKNSSEYNIEVSKGSTATQSNYGDSLSGNGSITLLARTQDPKSNCSNLKKNIYVYSFSLNPEEHQPSGTMNFSRINSSKLKIEEAKKIDFIYAVNYNILRISGGTANLLYTN